ncbi:nitrite reductase (NAD(P)H) small subunit-like protein [Sarcoptes scabiei]|nr:nitrite reductase (NAD(P)H) small subunit-like protein [Sarcoptes scabiei]
MSDSRFQEKLICRLDEISLNQTKVVLVNDVKICVYRQSSDEILAFGNECSHFGAPLNSG